MSTLDLFADEPPMGIEPIGPQSVVLRGHALPHAAPLLAAVDGVMAQAPLRHLVTPGGFTMSVAMTNCGALGWTSDRRGYRYSAIDPVSGQPWPAMPA
ncbi:alpha-ketoglutarate-dependent dioxygenase AlkB, partial [Delftia tsuruhatensis]